MPTNYKNGLSFIVGTIIGAGLTTVAFRNKWFVLRGNKFGFNQEEESYRAGQLDARLKEAFEAAEKRKQMYDTNKYNAITVTTLNLPDGRYDGMLDGYTLTVNGLTAQTDVGLRNTSPGNPAIVDVKNKVGYIKVLPTRPSL